MPFTTYKEALDPETMKAARAAFDLASSEISVQPVAGAARDLLAKRIIEAALQSDECDPKQLKAYALAGFKP
jgi:hypothetical protein